MSFKNSIPVNNLYCQAGCEKNCTNGPIKDMINGRIYQPLICAKNNVNKPDP